MESIENLKERPNPKEYENYNFSKELQTKIWLWAGLLSISACVASLVMLFYYFVRMGYIAPIGSSLNDPIYNDPNITAKLLDHYIGLLSVPVILIVVAILAAIFSYLLIKSSGAAEHHIIPPRDYNLLSNLINNNQHEGIDEYIRLSSLRGVTGFFTKLGLSGLPLATIGLTIIFSILAIYNSQLFDLAKLTLGAFLGSYVQKNIALEKFTKKE
jgi:hypothetical protein